MKTLTEKRKLQVKIVATAFILFASGYFINYSAKNSPHQVNGNLFESAYADIQDGDAGK
jgi:hypothetical protein